MVIMDSFLSFTESETIEHRSEIINLSVCVYVSMKLLAHEYVLLLRNTIMLRVSCNAVALYTPQCNRSAFDTKQYNCISYNTAAFDIRPSQSQRSRANLS